MSLEDAIITAGSAVVVAFLVFMVWLLGFRTALKLDAEIIRRELAYAEPGAALTNALTDTRGRNGLGELADGRLLIARAMADGASLRLLPRKAAKVSLEPNRVRVRFADLGYPPLDLHLDGPAPAWLAALAQGEPSS
jgi:hypothetical protein